MPLPIRVALRKDLIHERLRERFGSPAMLAEAIGVERTTVWRWLNGSDTQFPRDDVTMLKLAAALDIDPFFIWDFGVENFSDVCAHILSLHLTGEWEKLLPALSFVKRFLMAGEAWPPPDVAAGYGSGHWTVVDFAHDSRRGQKNYYAPLLIEGGAADPQVWHFAFRDNSAMRTISPWRHYGFVVLWHRRLLLFNINGDSEEIAVPDGTKRIVVETYFGEGPAAFRAVSLHPFRLDLVDAALLSGPRVRFAYH